MSIDDLPEHLQKERDDRIVKGLAVDQDFLRSLQIVFPRPEFLLEGRVAAFKERVSMMY